MNLFKLLNSAFKRLMTATTSPFRMLWVRFQRLFNVNILTAKLVTPLTKKIKQLLELRPKSEKDYVTIGRFWVFRKLFLTLTLVICAGVFMYFTMIADPLPTQPVEPEAVKTDVVFSYDDMKLGEYSGMANIKDAKDRVIYVGEVDKGVCKGQGTLYDREGNLLYEGEFDQNQYQGQGIRYHSNGQISYQGEFSANKYNGAGKLYNKKGVLLYDGNFKDGRFDGSGKQFDSLGTLVYEGEFVQGARHGNGVQYNASGNPTYEGAFYLGEPQGQGTLYNDYGKKIYEGSMYKGAINYPSLIHATLEDVERSFLETPIIYYKGNECCFMYEQAGVAITLGCKVQVYTQVNENYLPPPGSIIPSTEGVQPTAVPYEMSQQLSARPAARSLPEVSLLGSTGTAEVTQLSSYSAEIFSQATPVPTPTPIIPQIIVQPPVPEKPEIPSFIEKNLTLYFEVDDNVWMSEEELDKSKVFVKEVVVCKPGPECQEPVNKEPPAGAIDCYEQDAPLSLRDFAAIEYMRDHVSNSSFGQYSYTINHANSLFVEILAVDGAQKVDRVSYTKDGLTYQFNRPYDPDNTGKVILDPMYYTISRPTVG